nr:MAG TPA: hypothetical protein [Caudoviricetes sp.]
MVAGAFFAFRGGVIFDDNLTTFHTKTHVNTRKFNRVATRQKPHLTSKHAGKQRYGQNPESRFESDWGHQKNPRSNP